jgi:presenilin-like A22 family membrane protease
MKYRQPKNIREKNIKKEYHKKFWNIFFIEGILFSITSFLVLLSSYQINKLIKNKEIYLPQTSLQSFLLYFTFITFFILFFVFLKKAKKIKNIFYKGIFLITCFFGGMTILNLFLPIFVSTLLIGILIIWWIKKPTILIHDALMILGLAGVGSFLGLEFFPSEVVMLLFTFSIYDFIAVYKTKHMVAMAKDMIENNVILGFIIPKDLKYFKDNVDKVKPNGNFMILGGGDVIFPNLLLASVIPSGILRAMLVYLFSFLGMFLSYWLFSRQEEVEPIPALPPIAFLSIVGYLITSFF